MSELSTFVLIAHRGNSADAPENTIPSFDSSIDAGFPHFETDCQLTVDGVVVVLHDEQLGRTTPGAQGAVAETSWAALQDMDAGSWFDPRFAAARIPKLANLLQRYQGRAHIHLELKSPQPDLPRRVAEELSAAGGGWLAAASQQLTSDETEIPAAQPAPTTAAEGEALTIGGVDDAAAALSTSYDTGLRNQDFKVPGLTITSFHLEQLRRSLQLLPGVVHGWLVHELTDLAIQEAVAAGCRQICPRANVLTADRVKAAVAAGLSVRAWGVKDLQLLRHVVQCGCQGATVNWPREAQQELLLLGRWR